MILLKKQSDSALRAYLARQQALAYTYAGVGSTAGTPPAGYVVDRAQVKVGQGAEAFAAARAALERWEQFRLGWVEIGRVVVDCSASPSRQTRDAWPRIVEGETVAVSIRVFGAWWRNAARIVYVVDESSSSIARFGFAYGTLPGHAESGEEQFLVEWDRATDEVSYSILAFSRPRHWLARLGRPLVRRLQRRFQRDSLAAMQRAVEGERTRAPARPGAT